MHTGSRPPLATKISWAATLCLVLGGLLVMGCDRPASDLPASSSVTPRPEAPAAGVVLRANPNPVRGGSDDVGETTITWQTGSSSVADVYVVEATGNEKLFARGSKGSVKAPWIQP